MQQLELIQVCEDYSDKRVMIGLSGGINSAAVLAYLASEYPQEYRPKRVYLYYSHLAEHSKDTGRFVIDCIRYAFRHFETVRWCVRIGSVLKFFEKEGIIPHPIISPCSEHLKFAPMQAWGKKHNIDIDLIGYIRTERNRRKRQIDRGVQGKAYPIAHLTDEDCKALCRREIGYYPAIYDIEEDGCQVFKHNNCLPCKNMQGVLTPDGSTQEYKAVEVYFPEYHERAREASEKIGAYWGRKADFDGYCKFCEFD